MKYLLLASLLLFGCTDSVKKTEYRVVINNLSDVPVCFKYPTYVSYPTAFGIDHVTDNNVYIVIRTTSDCSVQSTSEGIWYCGFKVETVNQRWSANNQSKLNNLEKVDCSQFGKIFKRK